MSIFIRSAYGILVVILGFGSGHLLKQEAGPHLPETAQAPRGKEGEVRTKLLSDPEMDALLGELRFGFRDVHDIYTSGCIRQWASRDPRGAFEEIMAAENLDPELFQSILAIIAFEWGRDDPAGLEAASDRIEHTYARDLFLRNGMKGAISHDSEFVFEWMKRNKWKDRKGGLSYELLLEHAAHSPLDAMRRSGEHSDRELSRSMQLGVASRFARDSPDQAFQWALAFEPDQGMKKGEVLQSVMESLSYAYPEKAIQFAELLPDTLSDREDSTIKRSVVIGLAETHPMEASQLLDSISVGNEYDLGLQVLAQKWGTKDFEAAKVWLQTIDDPRAYRIAEQSLLAGYTLQNPSAAAQLAMTGEASEGTAKIYNFVAEQWSQLDPEGASRWLMSMSKQNLATSAMVDVLETWMVSDPTKATEFLMKNETDFRERRVFPAFFEELAERDPLEALKKAEQLSEARDRTAAEFAVAETFGSKDPVEAIKWLQEKEGEEHYGQLAAQIAGGICEVDPMKAYEVSKGIPDTFFRFNGVYQAAYQIALFDKDLAIQLIEQAELPEKLRKDALNGL